MAAETTTQLITVAATLSGVVLTLVANGYSERRRARDARDLEALRLGSEHAHWLRNERVAAYAGLSAAGEAVLQYLRVELGGGGEPREEQWRALRGDLRQAYNRVALLGTERARSAALEMWRAGRDAGNDYWRQLKGEAPPGDLTEAVSRFGAVGDRFMEVCRADLRVDQS